MVALGRARTDPLLPGVKPPQGVKRRPVNTSTGVELALCLADLPSVWPRRCGVDMVLPYGSGLLKKNTFCARPAWAE